MLAAVLALCLAGPPQSGSLLQQIAPNPTGRNGYEDYLRAAEIVGGDASFYLGWQPGQSKRLEEEAKERVEDGERIPPDLEAVRLLPLARRLEKMSVLEIRKELVGKFGVALEWVRQGNQKPVFDPRRSIGASTLFPELSRFRTLARLAVAQAYVRDSEGRTAEGTDALLQIVDMGDRIGGTTLISLLVGIAEQSIALAALQSRLDRLSQAEAQGVSEFVGSLLARPPVVIAALKGEARFLSTSLEELLAKPEEAGLSGTGDPVVAQLASLNQADRSRLIASMRKNLDWIYAPLFDRLSGPESGWAVADPEGPEPSEIPQTLEDLGDTLLTWLIPPFGTIGTSAARVRTQLRLLGLAGRVLSFRWEHERLPNTLDEAAPASEIADPLSGEAFQYAPMGDRFRVFSKGVPQTGEIDIRYQRSANLGAPPPPGR